jgi:hypothetical protein
LRGGGYGRVEWSPGFGGRADVDGEGDVCGEDVRDGEEEKGKGEESHLEMDDWNAIALMLKTWKRKVELQLKRSCPQRA